MQKLSKSKFLYEILLWIGCACISGIQIWSQTGLDFFAQKPLLELEPSVFRRLRLPEWSTEFRDIIGKTQQYSEIFPALESLAQRNPLFAQEFHILFNNGLTRREFLCKLAEFLDTYPTLLDIESTFKLMIAGDIYYYILNDSSFPLEVKEKLQTSSVGSLLEKENPIWDYIYNQLTSSRGGNRTSNQYRQTIQDFLDNLLKNQNALVRDVLTILFLFNAKVDKNDYSIDEGMENFLLKICEDSLVRHQPPAIRLLRDIYYLAHIRGLRDLLKKISHAHEEAGWAGHFAHLEAIVELEKYGYQQDRNDTKHKIETVYISLQLKGGGVSGEVDVLVLDSTSEKTGLSWVEVGNYQPTSIPSAILDQPASIPIYILRRDKKYYRKKIVNHLTLLAEYRRERKSIEISEGKIIRFVGDGGAEVVVKKADGSEEVTKLDFSNRFILVLSFKDYEFPTKDGQIDYSAPQVESFISEAKKFFAELKKELREEVDPGLVALLDGLDIVVIPRNLDDSVVKYLGNGR
ncbi:MAG: hypothetical protein AB7E08_02895 [Candidatus Omnitrophota bacterium]